MKREVIEKIGGFDEQLINSYDDNDLCLRAQLAGYKLAIAFDTYIHHVGQGTLRTQMDAIAYMKNGYENRERYFDKFYTATDKKLVAVYRTNGGPWLEESLRQTSKFADSIVIHFCRARGNVDGKKHDALLKQFPKIVHTEFYDGIFQEDYERGRLLEIALDMNARGEADWCISIDDDELYEDAFVARVKKMINPRNPEIFGYWCQWRTIWDKQLGNEYFRKDSTFGKFSNYRLFKLMPVQEIFSMHPEGHHCGSAPAIAPENLRTSKLRVKHMGYDTPEQRQKKFEFYQANDHFKSKADIGFDDYSHLVDINVHLQLYRPKNDISLIMMVKNEEEHIRGLLENIEDIVDEMIIVDTGSTDHTMEIINSFAKYSTIPIKTYVYTWEDNYSTPRNFAKSKATGEWILMMDADERFDLKDFNELFQLTEMDADGFIFHVFNYLEPKTMLNPKPKFVSSEATRLYRNTADIYYTGILHETLDDAYSALRRKRKVNIWFAPLPLHHYGYLKPKDKIQAKLEYYVNLNKKQIEITEGKDPRPYFNLGMHYLNDDKDKAKGIEAFQEALKLNPKFWHANQQMAALNIKSAREYLIRTVENMPKAHPFRKDAVSILEYMDSHIFGHEKVTGI